MIQLFGLLAISWALLWLFEKKNLSVLGLMPSKKRLVLFVVLFVVSAICAASAVLLRMYIAQEEYMLTPGLTAGSITEEIVNQVRTVFTEELLCRGALLYILIKKTGMKKAIFITAGIFALLHWFNAGVWGDISQMSLLFLITFTMGLLLSYSYTKTFSLLVPFGIHFGWNLTQNYIFPGTTAGEHIFSLAATPPTVTVSWFAFLIMFLLPKIALLVLGYLIIRRTRQEPIP